MFFLAGAAASNALDLISALQQTLAGKNASATTTPANGQNFDVSAGANASTASGGTSSTATSPLAPSTMNALLSAQGDAQTSVVNGDAFSAKLFSMLDTNGDGSISQSEFDSVFNKNGDTTKADTIFAKIDANQDGNVSPDELTNALSGQGQGGQDGGGQQVHHRRHHHGLGGIGDANSLMGGSSDPNDPFSIGSSSASNDPFSGDSSQTVTNQDGSSTTTISYADGSQVTMTTPASSGSGSSPSSMAHNFIERMIQRQARMMATQSAGQALAISA
jgi:hypothetical protein